MWKRLGFPHKNTYNICHFINMYICKDRNATVGYRNWLETWTSRCDVRVYYLYRVKIERKRKASIRDLMTNSSSYTRDSFLEIRQKWKKKSPSSCGYMFFMVGDSNLTKINRIGLRGSTMQADNIDWTDGTKIRIAAVEGRDKKKVNENKKVLVISCSSSIKRFQSHCN